MKYNTKYLLSLLEELDINYICSKLDDIWIDNFCNLDDIKDNAITWIKIFNDNNNDLIENHKKTIFICSIDNWSDKYSNVIFIENLKINFFKLIKILFEERNFENIKPCIENSAVVLSKKLGNNIYVGHHTFIDKNVKIGNNVMIMNNVTIQGDVIIGDNSFIESGAVIGVCGFGLFDDKQENSEILPHLGRVIIGNNVRIGAATCIARGCLCDTVIEDYVKVDNLCHIAHNVILKRNSKIVACSEISGGVIVGENSWIAPNSSIIQHTIIGKNVNTGMASNILRDVPDNSLIYGNPARVKGEKNE